MNKKVVGYTILFIAILIGALFLFEIISSQTKISLEEQQEITEPTITRDDAITGEIEGDTSIVLFGFIGCDNCERMSADILSIIEDNPDRSIQYVWKEYPNTSIAPDALSAALAARCAQEQEAFWEYHEYLRLNTNILNEEIYLQIAKELDLKERRFTSCMNNDRSAELVQRHIAEGDALGITATPTVYINGERYTGALTKIELQNILNEIL